MISLCNNDITKINASVIVNASNAFGIMGSGVAGAIARAGGPEIQKEAMIYCRLYRPEPGSVFRTRAGSIDNCAWIYHSVTMEHPGTSYRNDQDTGLNVIRKCIQNALLQFKGDPSDPYYIEHIKAIESIAISGLGIGIGGLSKEKVSRIMMKSAIDMGFIKSRQRVIFCDLDTEFTDYCKQAFKELTNK